MTKSMRDASTQSISHAERNPGPAKHQIRHVQIRNLAILDQGSVNRGVQTVV